MSPNYQIHQLIMVMDLPGIPPGIKIILLIDINNHHRPLTAAVILDVPEVEEDLDMYQVVEEPLEQQEFIITLVQEIVMTIVDLVVVHLHVEWLYPVVVVIIIEIVMMI